MKQRMRAAPVALNLTVCHPETGIIWCLICRASCGIWLWNPEELRLLFRHMRNVCVTPQMGQQTAVCARSLMEWILDANQIFKWMYSPSGRTIPVDLQTCFYIKFWLLEYDRQDSCTGKPGGYWLALKKGSRSPQLPLLAESTLVFICLLPPCGYILFNHTGLEFMLAAVFYLLGKK